MTTPGPECKGGGATANGGPLASWLDSRRSAPPPDADGLGYDDGPKVETFTAAELMAMELPEPRWAVGGILPDGLTILAGKPKLGKSWLALNLALAVSTGGVALGSVPVAVGNVLYLALEDTKRRLQSRLRVLLGSQDTAPPARLTLAREWPRARRGGHAAVAAWLARNPGARLVVIDTWVRFKPPRAGGDPYEEDSTHGGELKAIADAAGVAVLLVHHCRKLAAEDPLEEVGGSIGLTGAADGVLVLRRERGRHDAELHVTGRDVEEQELALTWDKRHCLWSMVGAAAEFRVSQERAAVLAVLRKAAGPLTPSAAAAALGKTPNAVKKLMWTMEQDGQLEGRAGGKYVPAPATGNPGNPVTGAAGLPEGGGGGNPADIAEALFPP